jgi:hypothetical protein
MKLLYRSVIRVCSLTFDAAAVTGAKRLVLDEAGTFRSDASAFLFRLEPSPACELLLSQECTALNGRIPQYSEDRFFFSAPTGKPP